MSTRRDPLGGVHFLPAGQTAERAAPPASATPAAGVAGTEPPGDSSAAVQLKTLERWRQAAEYWLPHLRPPRAVTVGGKPLVILFDPKFGQHVRDLIAWMNAHPSEITEERLALLYAWNEIGEGGSLVPSRGDPAGAYLRELKGALTGTVGSR